MHRHLSHHHPKLIDARPYLPHPLRCLPHLVRQSLYPVFQRILLAINCAKALIQLLQRDSQAAALSHHPAHAAIDIASPGELGVLAGQDGACESMLVLGGAGEMLEGGEQHGLVGLVGGGVVDDGVVEAGVGALEHVEAVAYVEYFDEEELLDVLVGEVGFEGGEGAGWVANGGRGLHRRCE
jgi:hypothetical protein